MLRSSRRTPTLPRPFAFVALAALLHLAPVLGIAKDAAQPPLFFTGSPALPAFQAAMESELSAAQSALDAFLAQKEKRTVASSLTKYNEIMTRGENAAYGSYLMGAVHPDSTFRAGAEALYQRANKFLDDLSLNRAVYDALVQVDASKEDAATRYFLTKTLQDFRLAGVDKDEATRKEISALLDLLTKTGQEFSRNIRSDSRTIQVAPEDLAGLPDDFIQAHAPGPDGKVTLSIENPDYFPVIRYATSGELRRRLMHEDLNRAYPANMAVLDSLIAQRHRLAQLLGFPTWADYITVNKMIETSRNAADFIERLRETTYKRAQDEYAIYLKRKQEDDPAATQVNRWEMSYYGRLIRKRDYDFDPQEVRAYLPFDRVKQGVFGVSSKLFGLTFQRVENAAVWHPSVEAYEVYDGKKLLGRFFLDLHPRAGKFNHAAKFSIRQGVQGVQVPEHALVCNFPGGRTGDPGLMEHSDVETFFHEFGHLMHAILGGQGRWEPVAGTAVQRDFVEAPSQMLEEWVFDAKVLQTFAQHHQTQAPIPTALVEKMRRADAFGRALGTATQAYYSAISLNIYNTTPDRVNTDELVASLEPRYTPVPRMDNTHMQTSFGHLDGYSAVYYTYQWSLVISKDMFSKFNRRDLLSPTVAREYRQAVLAPGGTKPAKELVRDFLKRDYDFKAFDAWLAGKD